jgi:hypothetical protein
MLKWRSNQECKLQQSGSKSGALLYLDKRTGEQL